MQVVDKNNMKTTVGKKLPPKPPARWKFSFFSPWTMFTFSWVSSLLTYGNATTLTQEDLPECYDEDTPPFLFDKFTKSWKQQLDKKDLKKASFTLAAYNAFSWWYCIFLPCKTACVIAATQFLGALIDFYGSTNKDFQHGLWLSIGLCLSSYAVVTFHHIYFFYAWRRGLQLRIGSLTMVYKNLLSLRLESFNKISTGHIVNLASADIERLQMAGIFAPFIIWAPTEATIIFIFMFIEVGIGSIVGFAILLLGIPITSYFGKIFAEVRTYAAAKTDERNKIVREIIDGIRVVKGNAFEEAFFSRTKAIRTDEVEKVHKRARMLALNEGIFTSMPCLVLLATFFVASALGEHVTSRKIFVMLSLANVIQLNLTKFFTFSVQNAAEGLITFKRLKEYLILSENESIKNLNRNTDNPIVLMDGKKNSIQDESVAVKFDNASFSYGDGDNQEGKIRQMILNNLNFEVKSKELIGICGKVGSGKSSLLLSILGEMVLEKGNVNGFCATGTAKPIGYAAQEPWMRSATIKENILFGGKMDVQRYNEVIKACALEDDLNTFEHGDLTIIGEKGINLSGGQKARVALARACYQKSDIFLLDDPLSAVDTIVAEHLFNQCVVNFLKSTTRILVTHQVQFLPQCDCVIILDDENGTVKHIGTYSELVNAGVVFPTTEKGDDSEDDKEGEETSKSNAEPESNYANNSKLKEKKDSISIDDKQEKKENVQGKQQGKSVVQKEDSETGVVRLDTYVQFFAAGLSKVGIICLVLLMLTTQFNFVIVPYWVTLWAKQTVEEQQNHQYWFGILAIIGGCLILQAFLRSILFFKSCIDSSYNLFNRMLRSVLYSPIGFFDSNPSGRILNRFSSDTGQVDDLLPPAFYDFVALSISAISYIIITLIVVPFTGIFLLPVIIVFIRLRKKFLQSSREVKRLEALSRSPVFTHISESLSGLVTVRAFKKSKDFQTDFFNKQYTNVKGYFAFIAVNRWFGARLDMINMFYLTIFIFMAILFQRFHNEFGMNSLDDGLVGMSLTYILSLCDVFQWCVRQSAEVENLMVSTERILAYIKLPSEPPHKVPKDAVVKKQKWPQKGELELKNLSIRYRKDLPYTLNNISCKIPSGASVAVVGRTAAGKTTLVQALLRLIEPNGPVKNNLFVDGIDCGELGLKLLRENIMLINQLPWLYSGTLRENLDPFNEYTDERMWKCLEMASVSKQFRNLNGLDTVLSESGGNLSVGEKQLVCLARSILGENKIFIFDEPTANIDIHTDRIIQNAIREMDVLKEATIITIAHRLATIIDYDLVMVMENGELIQFGEPHLILTEKTDIVSNKFLSMVNATGPDSSEFLKRKAKEAYEGRRKK